MRKFKAYTLMEMLVVMTIMIIVLSVGIFSYIAYIETTKYNQDVANIQHDILTMQRASMLFKKKPEDGWIYGLGIDFQGLIDEEGTYRFFKWCSGYDRYGADRTTGKYPNYDSVNDVSLGIGDTNYSVTTCQTDALLADAGGELVSLSGYGAGNLNLGEDVLISGGRFLLFESVTGRAFIFADDGSLVNGDLTVTFNKRRGTTNELTVENLTGRTKLSGYTPDVD